MANDTEATYDANLHNEPIFVDPALLGQAEQVCLKRLKTDPDNRVVLRSLAELYRKLGRLEDAAGTYDKLFALDPQDQEADYLRAVLHGVQSPAPAPGIHASPFVLVKNFLPKEFHDSLLPFVTANQEKFVPSRVGRHAEYKPEVRQTLEFNQRWEEGERFRRHFEQIPGMFSRLHLTPFVADISAIRLRTYQDGHFFRVHIDAEPDSPSVNRVFNFVYFFHRVPRAYTGGELLLFDSDPTATKFTRSRFTRVVPEDNSIILFPCTFFHSVLAVRCPSGEFADARFVVNGHVSRRVGEGQARADETFGSLDASRPPG